MDTRTGNIITPEQAAKMNAMFPGRAIPMTLPPTQRQMARRPRKVGRNEPCPCGSGRKFKKCCLAEVSA